MELEAAYSFQMHCCEYLLNKVLFYWPNKYVQLFDWLLVSVDQLMFSIFRSCLKTNKDGS